MPRRPNDPAYGPGRAGPGNPASSSPSLSASVDGAGRMLSESERESDLEREPGAKRKPGENGDGLRLPLAGDDVRLPLT